VLNAELRSAWLTSARGLAAASAFVQGGVALRRATIELSLARLPQHWGYLVCAGVPQLVRAVERIAPEPSELKAAEQLGCMSPELAQLMATGSCALDINVAPEGALLFAGDPIATVEGPLWQAWLVSEVARNILLTAAAVATRAARLVAGAAGAMVVDGSSCLATEPLRAVSIARAACVGGITTTQSPIASARLGIPLRASAPPDAAALLAPSQGGRSTLWNFTQSTQDVLMNLGPGDDEEETLGEMRRLGVRAGAWVARALGQVPPGLEGRVDLVALEQGGIWMPRLGAVPDITVVPGRKLLIRYQDAAARPIADIMHGVGERIQEPRSAVITGYLQTGISVPLDGAESGVPVLTSVVRSGTRVGPDEELAPARDRTSAGLRALPEPYRRLRHPARFPVGMAPAVAQLKSDMLEQMG
jgi:hypothetical protein